MDTNKPMTRRDALKRMAKFAISVAGVSVLSPLVANAQFYYKYYNYYNSGYGKGDYSKYYNYYRNYYNRYYNYLKYGF